MTMSNGVDPRLVPTLSHILGESERQERELSEVMQRVEDLSADGKRRLFLQLVKLIEADAGPVQLPQDKHDSHYADRAEAFVLSAHGGVTTRDVAAHIGQALGICTRTLTHVMASRGTIVQRNRRWYPRTIATTVRSGPTMRQMILSVLKLAGGVALAPKEILHALKEGKPVKYKHFAEMLNELTKSGHITRSGTPHNSVYQIAPSRSAA